MKKMYKHSDKSMAPVKTGVSLHDDKKVDDKIRRLEERVDQLQQELVKANRTIRRTNSDTNTIFNRLRSMK